MLKRYAKIYWLYFTQYWKSRLIYKTDFLIGATGHLISVAVSLAFLTLVFTQIETLQGWTFNEMLFLSGFGGLVIFTHHVFLFNAIRLGEDYILSGDLDRILLRPLNPLFQLYSDDVRDSNLPKVIANIGLLVYSTIQLQLVLTPIKILYAVASFFSGLTVIASLYLLFSTTAFWTGTSRNAVWLIFRLSNFRKYPLNIFGIVLQVLMVTLVPLAFASFFPASFILGKQGYQNWQLVTPFIGPIFFLLAYKFWDYGISNYSSTGS